MSELTVKVAEVPLNLTDVVPVKAVPVIVTLAPTVRSGRETRDAGLDDEIPRAAARAGRRRDADRARRRAGGHGRRDLDRRVHGEASLRRR